MTESCHTVAVIRAQEYGVAERRLAEAIRPWFGDNVLLGLNSRTTRSSERTDMPTFLVNESVLDKLGLFPVEQWGWLCGDYTQIAAADAFPDFSYYWMIEPDVVFNFPQISDFFSIFSHLTDDFLAYDLGLRSKQWLHHSSVDEFYGAVWGCLFPLTRISKNAINYIQIERQRYAKTWLSSAPEERKKFANDEAFVCSSLKAAGMNIRALDAMAPKFFQKTAYTTNRLILTDALDEMAKVILHPVVEKSDFLKKLSSRITSGNLQNISYHSEIVKKYFGEAENEHFHSQASRVLNLQHNKTTAAPPINNSPNSDMFAQAFFILNRTRKQLWNLSKASDFTYGSSVQRASIDFKRVLPYAADYQNHTLMLVDTIERQIELEPFLFVTQYKLASYAIFAPLNSLPKEIETDGEDFTFVFSIGRCGSTLTSNLAKACDITSYSECDALMGLPQFVRNRPQDKEKHLLRRTLGALKAFQNRNHIVVKMKSQSNADIAWFTECFPKARYIFLTRSIEPWALSFSQVFNWSAQQMFHSLQTAVAAHQHLLAENKLTDLIVHEELSRNPSDILARLFGIAAKNADPMRVHSVLSAESQSGLLPKSALNISQARTRVSELRALIEQSPNATELLTSPLIVNF